MRDIQKAEDPQIAAIVAVIAQVAPDVLVLTDFDYDLDARALSAFARMTGYDHWFASQPNSGLPTGLDMDGDGYLGDGSDAQGFGRFSGDGGMAVVSKLPIGKVADYSATLWADLDGAIWPMTENGPFPSVAAFAIQRLSSTGHWTIQIDPQGVTPFEIIAFSATPPVFDGPEDQNGLRNRDELRLARAMMEDTKGMFFVVGNANLDSVDGQGFPDAMAEVLADPRLQDPMPASAGGLIAMNPDHNGNPALDTADWPDDGPGNLRVSYVLPSKEWDVTDAGVFWPAPEDPLASLLGGDGQAAGPHRLVWVDVAR